MAESKLPQSMAELLANIDGEWTALMRLAAQLTPEKMAQPDEGGWSPKDNLAHLGEWMKMLMGYHMDHRPSHEVVGVTPEVVEGWDFDRINAILFERHRGESADQVMAELKKIYVELLGRLRSMSFEDVMKPRHADDPEKRPLLLWILSDTSEHFAEHRETMQKSL